jgi:4-hydroxybenzoate polyprenyltransferase
MIIDAETAPSVHEQRIKRGERRRLARVCAALIASAARSIHRETVVSWSFIRYDISATIMPALLFMLAAWHAQRGITGAWVGVVGQGLLYFWLYVYTFCLANQLAGIAEDRQNKPNRPLVSGVSSIQGARVRWVVFMGLFTLVGCWFGVWVWTLVWQVVLILHNFKGWAKRWYTKNLVMSLGVTAQLAAAWQLVTPLTPVAWSWIGLLASAIFYLISLQDLRDIAGDRAIGRATFPMVFGETATRVLLALGFTIMPLAIHAVLMWPLGMTWPVRLCDGGLALLSVAIAARVLTHRTPEGDHRTYMLFTYWYCAVLASAIIVM